MQTLQSEHESCHPGEHLPKGKDQGFNMLNIQVKYPTDTTMNYAFGMDVFKALGHLQYLPQHEHQKTVKRRDVVHIFQSLLLMDSFVYATGLKCRSSYMARRA